MKNLFKAIIVAAAAISAIGCSKDKTVDPYDINYLYFYAPSKDSHSYLYYANTGEFTTNADSVVCVPARLTKPAPEDLIVSISINNNLVEEYNKANETEYQSMEKAAFKNSELRIAKGEYITEDIVLKLNKEELQNGKVLYLVPVTISGVSASGVTISESNTFYLKFESTKYTEISCEIEKASSAEGTAIENCKLTLNGSNLTLPYGWYHQYSSPSITMTFDGLKKVKSVAFNWFAWYYAAKSVVAKVSSASFGVLADGTSNEVEFNPDSADDFIVFKEPVEATQISLTLKGAKYEDGFSFFPYLNAVTAYEVE